MSSIPEEICFDILLKVPVTSLLACKCVCKAWFSLISNPDFVSMQLNQRNDNPNLMFKGATKSTSTDREVFYSVSHDSWDSLLSRDKFLHDYTVELDYPFKSVSSLIKLMCCCDGLVCLWFVHKELFCIWNPATREYKKLPKSNIPYVTMVAFGYDYKTNDYKILAGCESSFEVCSLGSNSWKRIENVPYKFYGNQSGVLVNGDLHWLASEKRPDSSKVIISMDISNEIFKEIELPQELKENSFNLGVLEGCLCSLAQEGVDMHLEIWVMQNYGVQESWTKRYTMKNIMVVNSVDLKLVCSFKTGEILFAGTWGQFSYDPEYGSTRRPNISSLTYLDQLEVYSESLVSLKSRTYVGGEEQIEEQE